MVKRFFKRMTFRPYGEFARFCCSQEVIFHLGSVCLPGGELSSWEMDDCRCVPIHKCQVLVRPFDVIVPREHLGFFFLNERQSISYLAEG